MCGIVGDVMTVFAYILDTFTSVHLISLIPNPCGVFLERHVSWSLYLYTEMLRCKTSRCCLVHIRYMEVELFRK